MKKILKIMVAVILVAAIGAGGFAIYKSTQGISYDISTVKKLIMTSTLSKKTLTA